MSSGSRGWRRVNEDWLVARLAEGKDNYAMARELMCPREYIRDARRAYGLAREVQTHIPKPPEAVPVFDRPRNVVWPAGIHFEDDPRAMRPEGRFIGVRAETFTGYRESMS